MSDLPKATALKEEKLTKRRTTGTWLYENLGPLLILPLAVFGITLGVSRAASCDAADRESEQKLVMKAEGLLNYLYHIDSSKAFCEYQRYLDRGTAICYFEDATGKDYQFICPEGLECRLKEM